MMDVDRPTSGKNNGADSGRLGRLAHFTARHRWPVIGVWIALTLLGGVAAGKLSSRWYQSFSIPGKSAYEANQRTLKAFGSGVRPPNVVVFHTSGDATKSDAIKRAMQRAAATMPGARTSSYFSTGSLLYVSRPAHDVRGGLPARARRVRHQKRRRAHARRRSGWPTGRNHGGGDRP